MYGMNNTDHSTIQHDLETYFDELQNVFMKGTKDSHENICATKLSKAREIKKIRLVFINKNTCRKDGQIYNCQNTIERLYPKF